MDRGGDSTNTKFIREVQRWKHVGGGYDRETGDIIQLPQELMQARTIDALCQRYSCLPSQLLQEDANLILHIHALMKEAGDDEEQE